MAPTTTSDSSAAADAGVHGLSYPPGFLQSLPILLSRPAPHAPIRAITAEQFAEIHKLNAFADPDDAVLFPFLHGIEGSNTSQNSFFANASMRNSAAFYAHPLFQNNNHTVTIPKYRGLIWVRADEVSEHNLPSRSRTIDDYDEDGDEDELFEGDDDERDGRDETMREALHGDAFDGLHSRRHSSSSDSSSDSPLSVSTTPTSLMSPPPFQCTSITAPPHTPSHLLLSSLRADELLSANLDGPCFLPPRVPDGISL
jgi:dual specificity MAP kinase phosphatase